MGERNVCPMRWMKGAVEVLYERTKAYMTELMEDANLLALHTRRIMGHTVGMLYKGGGELGCEGLQFVGGEINFVKSLFDKWGVI